MTGITVFSFDDSVIRTDVDESGMVWFCARDVAEAIEHSKTTAMLELVEESERKTRLLPNSRGENRETAFINESGLYRVLFRSDKPKCKPFQDWLATEVLPSIRKTGSYSTNPIPAGSQDAMLLLPSLIAAAQAFGLSENQSKLAADQAIRKLTNDVIKPMLLLGVVLKEEKKEVLMTPTQIAKQWARQDYPSARAINSFLADIGLQQRVGEAWEPTALGKPFAEMLPVGKNHSNGTPVLQLKWKSSVLAEMDQAYILD